MNKVELLAPAGNFERLQMACIYGADAVYMAGKKFGLRAYADNFNDDELKRGIDFAHSMNKKVYITANIYANEDDLELLPEYFKNIYKIGADAVIISDMGVFAIAKKYAPDLEIHISTQANIQNHETAKLWHSMGAKRVVLGRELSLADIKRIRDNTPPSLELEAFVHGAMCMSYSGRCLLSSFMTSRSANHGECAQPCRWNYYLMEEQRPGQYMPVYEDERGTYILNANDMCMIEYIPELVEAGISSLKIEGRMKTVNYTATVTKQYRCAIDEYLEKGAGYKFDSYWMNEIDKTSHRPFSTGFYFGQPGQCTQTSTYVREYGFIGKVIDYNAEEGLMTVEQRNHFKCGEAAEIMQPHGKHLDIVIEKIIGKDGAELESAPHAQQIVKIPVAHSVEINSIIRRK